MWPSSFQQEDNSTQAKRLACDRCHDQKLRCSRPQQNEPCVRCAKAGVVCNVSAPQRTGRPRKSSAPRRSSEKGRKSPIIYSKELGPDGGHPDSGNSKESELVRAESSESIRPTISPFLRQAPDFSNNFDNWDSFACSSGSSLSSLSIAPPQHIQISTDDYADLLDCMTDQTYFDSMDIPGFPDCIQIESSDSLQSSMADLDPIARKSNTQRIGPYYTNPMSHPLPLLDFHASAQISPFPEMDMPIINSTLTSTTPPSESTTPDLSQAIMQHSEQAHCQTLAKLQSEIDVCAERIMCQASRMHPGSSSCTNERQMLSETLGTLLSTAEKFVELISCICCTFDTITSSGSVSQSPSPWASPFTQPSQMDAQRSYFGDSLDPSILTGCRPLSTSTFYMMLKCHIRLLSAYDTTLDAMPSRLLKFKNIDAVQSLTSALSIASLGVSYGAIIETLLHLQVISHQLDRLKTALHGNLLKLQPQRSIPNTRSLPARLGLCKQGRSPSVSMVDFKLEEIQERERALQTKLLRIESLAESSKQGPMDCRSLQQWM
ncbi:hypothetical protein EG329_013742 [Mollisiaceae sp. DMI_Dod_QoI]|nr:hypothetical protein EG329_013742 [Helotiales sp. DMI_Dod_QoI]